MNVVLMAILLISAKTDPKLVGAWGMGGEILFELHADGTGVFQEEPIRWSVDGKHITITDEDGESEKIPYKIESGKLQITFDMLTLELAKTESKKLTQPKEQPAGNDQLSQLLLSSAWCSFSYSQASGTSRTTRVVFTPQGTWSLGGNRETSWSGANGSYYGQSGSSGAGRWSVKNGQLFMSNPPETPDLERVELSIKRNSSGYPIITADGVEYSMCQ